MTIMGDLHNRGIEIGEQITNYAPFHVRLPLYNMIVRAANFDLNIVDSLETLNLERSKMVDSAWNDILECTKCHKTLDKPGGLVFSPPNGFNIVRKHHLCTSCYENLFYPEQCRFCKSHNIITDDYNVIKCVDCDNSLN